MRFYDMNCTYLGTKPELANALEDVTGIEAAFLRGARRFETACVATKMSWMAGRTTGRDEDIAYSMLGIFRVHLTPLYGEGMGAFMRLQDELLKETFDESLFAW